MARKRLPSLLRRSDWRWYLTGNVEPCSPTSTPQTDISTSAIYRKPWYINRLVLPWVFDISPAVADQKHQKGCISPGPIHSRLLAVCGMELTCSAPWGNWQLPTGSKNGCQIAQGSQILFEAACCSKFGLQVHILVVPLIRPQHLLRGLSCLFLAALSVNLLPLPFLPCIFDSLLRYLLACVALGASNPVRCRISYPFTLLSLCIVLRRTTVC